MKHCLAKLLKCFPDRVRKIGHILQGVKIITKFVFFKTVIMNFEEHENVLPESWKNLLKIDNFEEREISRAESCTMSCNPMAVI